VNRRVKEALQGARDIIAEWVSENEQVRNKVRQLFTESAFLYAKAVNAKKEEAEAQKVPRLLWSSASRWVNARLTGSLHQARGERGIPADGHQHR
jgi:transcriptional accessory protein Tex/SPT6